jgi:hypothetical protein
MQQWYETTIYEGDSDWQQNARDEHKAAFVEDMTTCKFHNYVRSNNGYYVECIGISTWYNRPRKTIVYRLRFPGHRMQNYLFLSKGKREWKLQEFIWTREATFDAMHYVMPQMKQFVVYLNAGYDMNMALMMAYPKYTSNQDKRLLLFRLYNSETFMQYLKDNFKMDDIKAVFNDAGVNEKWFAEQLKAIIEMPGDPRVKMKAMDTIQIILNTNKPNMPTIHTPLRKS